MFRAGLLSPEGRSCVLNATLLLPYEIRALAQSKEVVNLDLGLRRPLGSWMASACIAVARCWVRSSGFISSVQFSSVAQSCLTLCDPMNHSTQGLPVHHQLTEFTQTHVH